MSQNLFIFGLGYVAEHLGRRLMTEGWQVSGTTRSLEKAERLKAEGFRITGAEGVSTASHILVCTPPGDGNEMALDAIRLASNPQWVGYLSATSVYGAGGPFAESAATEPGTERGKARLQAEQSWQGLDIPLHIFRLAGIYGPGRNVLKGLIAGTARCISKDGHVFNRVHVDDIAATLKASMLAPEKGVIYNVADDEATAQDEVVLFGAKLLGRRPPPPEQYETAVISDALKNFYAESRTINNQLIKDKLGIKLLYPDYRAGLSGLIADTQD